MDLIEIATGMFRHYNRDLDFSLDGRYCAVTETGHDNSEIGIVEMATGKIVRLIRHSGGEINSAVFSPDSKFIATGEEGGTVKITKICD